MKRKFRIFGNTVVTVSTVVEMDIPDNEEVSEEALYKRAFAQCNSLTAFVGNGGTDKLIGVSGEDDTVAADDTIKYDDFEEVEWNDD